jgi:deazaflavin-dependent oxidoreductase (nitroreductase family)
MTNIDLDQLKEEDFCYLTTTGRVSGRSHTIEIWFAIEEKTLYMLAGGREKSDWVKNVLKNPAVQVRINKSTFDGQARIVGSGGEDVLARKLVLDKYTPRDSDDLTEWSRTSLPVAVELDI